MVSHNFVLVLYDFILRPLHIVRFAIFHGVGCPKHKVFAARTHTILHPVYNVALPLSYSILISKYVVLMPIHRVRISHESILGAFGCVLIARSFIRVAH